MAKPLVVIVPHNLGKAEADRRLRSGLERVGTTFGGMLTIAEQTWVGDRLEFRASLLGAATRGAIDVADDHITLTVDLPWFLGRLAEKARSLLSRQGRLMLDKK
jgi:putative polyhydroxyalkanoic acid system protein